jgi:hypothetical protein
MPVAEVLLDFRTVHAVRLAGQAHHAAQFVQGRFSL